MLTRLLQSPWTASSLGAVLYVAMMVAVWRPQAHTLVEPAPEAAQRLVRPSWAFHNPELDLLIEELRKQQEALAAKEKDLNEFAARLQTERNELNQLTQIVQQAQAEFDQNVVHVREQESANLKKLAKMYATMTPEGAATVFKTMDEATVVKVLACMREAESAPILDALAKQGAEESKRVATFSEKLRLSFSEAKKPAAP